MGNPADIPWTAIAAMSINRVIGADGKIPWHLSEDFKFFKRTTLGHVLLMGRKTFESIGKALPGRETWVLTRRDWSHPDVKIFSSLEAVPAPLEGKKLFLCGGADLYDQALHRCSELYLTIVKRELEGDAFFPPFEADYKEVETIIDNEELTIRRFEKIVEGKD